MTTKPIAISYIRFSSKKQEEGDSLRRQRDLATNWIAQNPTYTLSNISYEDLGLSASKGDHLHGNLGKILAAVESGSIVSGSVILVETLDRFSRLPALDTLTMLQKVLVKGVDLITLTDNQRYTAESVNGSQLFMLAAAAMAAYDYSKTLGRRVKESFEGRAEKAKAGQRINRRNGFWLTSDGVANERAPLVLEIFNKFVAGASIRGLAKEYGQYAEKEENRVFANASSARKLLQNIAVCGHWQRYAVASPRNADRQPLELVRDVFDEVVPEVLFYQAQQMMKRQLNIVRPSKNPIIGLIVCAECGKNMAMKNASVKTLTAQMACYSRMTIKESCSNSRGIPVPVLQHVFWETMKGAVLKSMQQAKLTSTDQARIMLKAKIENLEIKKSRLLRLIMASAVDDAILNESYAVVQDEYNQLTSELAGLPSDGEREAVSFEELYEFLNGDPMVITALLRMSDYRIVCNVDGEIFVGGVGGAWEGGESSLFTFQYSRKQKGYFVRGRGGEEFVA